jgi:hypothetical protein
LGYFPLEVHLLLAQPLAVAALQPAHQLAKQNCRFLLHSLKCPFRQGLHLILLLVEAEGFLVPAVVQLSVEFLHALLHIQVLGVAGNQRQLALLVDEVGAGAHRLPPELVHRDQRLLHPPLQLLQLGLPVAQPVPHLLVLAPQLLHF